MTSRLDEFFDGQPARMSVKEVAALLRVTEAAVYLWLANGSVPGYKFAGSWVILRDELKDSMLEGQSPALRGQPPLTTDTDPG